MAETSTPIQLTRDPFSRATLMRRLIDNPRPCDWCGSRPGRFEYGWESDGIRTRPAWQGYGFCSKSCMECFQ